MRILAHWDLKFLGLNSTNRLGWAGLGSGTQPDYQAPGNLHIREVKVTCSKLIQVQVMDSVSDKILKIYICIKSSNLCHHQLAKQ